MSQQDRPPLSANAAEAALLAESIREVVSRFVKSVREHSGTHSNAQNETLAVLERTGPVSISMLAERRGVTHQTMRLIVMKLAEQGLLILKKDAEDRRAYLVHVTGKGREQIARERSARVQWLTEQLIEKTSREERALLKAAVHTLDKLIR
ncbi:MarR family winged helix-turn-helix transcriptional regulator [Paraburkholderia tropica]|uniref:DNA-binding MarR family transcriptional regulator n=1 Tax=Paraburkholderia tropica TaxID=92647 RepID=A0ABX5MBI9_9BURK|nr:MarR family transcriptional regulator [Paraburkholderia tropica]OBR54697.1 MarR family transcriptional regulator [Paraburkholderia tropica]PXX00346.1 DNA-binding MarR family transcriptional regulator [Paraburkholderia tropica]PZW67517.1 DNA-binding MarR family transcriptional regulator [Paraburkholderia tropica]